MVYRQSRAVNTKCIRMDQISHTYPDHDSRFTIHVLAIISASMSMNTPSYGEVMMYFSRVYSHRRRKNSRRPEMGLAQNVDVREGARRRSQKWSGRSYGR